MRLRHLLPPILAALTACGGGNGETDENGDPIPELDPVAEEALNGDKAPLLLALPEEWTGGALEMTEPGFRLVAAEGLARAPGLPGNQGPLPDNALVLVDPAVPGSNLVLVTHRRPSGTLDDQFQESLEELRSHCPGFHLLDAGERFTSQGLRGRWLDFQWLVDGRVMSQRQFLFVTTEAFFTLTATWPAGAGPGAGTIPPDDALVATLESFDLL